MLTLLVLLATCDGPVQANGQAATTRPSQTDSRPAGYRKPPQAEILERLLRERETRRPILPAPPAESGGQGPSPASRPGAGEPLLLEGTMLPEKTGRVVLERDVYYFEFDALESHRGPRRMILLENQLLEQLLNEVESGRDRFRISGEVTRFRNRNYLLIKKAEQALAHGNLSP